MIVGLSRAAAAQIAAVLPGALRAYATIHSIGVEWDLTNNTDHDAAAAVKYRVRHHGVAPRAAVCPRRLHAVRRHASSPAGHGAGGELDEGASGVASVDATSGNTGGKYRTTDVDVESTTDTGGGYNVGGPNQGVVEVFRRRWPARERTRSTSGWPTSVRARGSTLRSTASTAPGR